MWKRKCVLHLNPLQSTHSDNTCPTCRCTPIHSNPHTHTMCVLLTDPTPIHTLRKYVPYLLIHSNLYTHITCCTYWSNSIHSNPHTHTIRVLPTDPIQSTPVQSAHKSPSQYILTYPNIVTTGMWVTPSFIQCSSYGNYRAWFIVNSQRNKCESFSIVYLSWKRVKSTFCLLLDEVNIVYFGFATTINKSQRLFFHHVDIYRPEPVFWIWLHLLGTD
jgi:hypothetical protein